MGTVRRIVSRPAPTPAITLGLIAHDAQKEALTRFVRAHRNILGSFRFLAPGDTAIALAELPLDIHVLAPDNQGGDLQVAAAVVEGRLDAVIFLHDPLAALPSEPSVATMLKVCDLSPIPIATNVASAEVLVHHLDQITERAERELEGEEPDDDFERRLVLTGPWSEGGNGPAANR